MTALLDRLAAKDILPIQEIQLNHYFFVARGSCAALIEHRDYGVRRVGASGFLSERGLAMLVWRGPSPFLVVKDWNRPATPEEVEALRTFSADVREALRS